MELIQLILTAGFSCLLLFVLAKCMGHKQISQLGFFDYITGITLGSMAAEMATNLEAPWKPFVSMLLFAAVSLLLNALSLKRPKLRPYLNGAPLVLFSAGCLHREALKKAKLEVNEFLMLCRQQGYFCLDRVETAVFEPGGTLSIAEKDSKTGRSLPAIVIADGCLVRERLAELGLQPEELLMLVQAQGFVDESAVMLGLWIREEGKLRCYGGT